MSYDLNDLRDYCHNEAWSLGWHDSPRTHGDMIALIHSELSEALECIRDNRPVTETWYREDGKPEGVPSELADVVIRVMDYCGLHGIDIDDAVEEKVTFNRTRGYRHGGKAL